MFPGSVNVLKDYDGTATTEGFFESLREVQFTFDGLILPNKSFYNPNITLYEYQHQRLNCSDASVIFSSIPALWNCLTLSGVALYLHNSTTTDAENLNSKLKEATSGLGIDLKQHNAKAMLDTAINCTVAACENHNCSTSRPNLEDMNASSAVHQAWLALQSVCDDLERWTANPDIVGPGVSIELCEAACNVRVADELLFRSSFLTSCKQLLLLYFGLSYQGTPLQTFSSRFVW